MPRRGAASQDSQEGRVMDVNTLSLFDLVDLAADAARAALPAYGAEDDQLVFRRLQKQRVPDLDREQFQTLFAEWRERYFAKAVIDHRATFARLVALTEACARLKPPAAPFRCVCGAESVDPFTSGFVASISRTARLPGHGNRIGSQ